MGAPQPFARKLSVLVLLVILAFAVACSKDEKPEVVTVNVAPLDLSETIVADAPENIFGFFYIDAKHEAYQRLLNSPWRGDDKSLATAFTTNPELKELAASLQEVGIDPTKRESWEKLWAKGVIYTGPGAEKISKPALGVLFESDGSIKLDALYQLLQKKITSSGGKVAEQKIEGGKGFSFVLDDLPSAINPAATGGGAQRPQSAKIPIYVAWSGQRSSIGTDLKMVTESLAGGSPAPSILKSEYYKREIVRPL